MCLLVIKSLPGLIEALCTQNIVVMQSPFLGVVIRAVLPPTVALLFSYSANLLNCLSIVWFFSCISVPLCGLHSCVQFYFDAF